MCMHTHAQLNAHTHTQAHTHKHTHILGEVKNQDLQPPHPYPQGKENLYSAPC